LRFHWLHPQASTIYYNFTLIVVSRLLRFIHYFFYNKGNLWSLNYGILLFLDNGYHQQRWKRRKNSNFIGRNCWFFFANSIGYKTLVLAFARIFIMKKLLLISYVRKTLSFIGSPLTIFSCLDILLCFVEANISL
jgi:hypothetical protein